MTQRKIFFYRCTGMLPLHWLTKTSPVNSLFPYHHIVSNEVVPHIFHLYPYKNLKQFTNDIDFLLKHFQPITPLELIQYINQHRQLPRKKFLLTMDDGFREVKEVVAPLLQAKGVPAIFFINPAFIDNKEMFYRNKISLVLHVLKSKKVSNATFAMVGEILSVVQAGLDGIKKALLQIDQYTKQKLDEIAGVLEFSFEDYLKEKRPWLTSAELHQLASQGFFIGAHSWDHAYYQRLSLSEQLSQTLESCNYVRQFQNDGITFSFPHSDKGLTQNFFDKVYGAGKGIDLLFGIQNQKQELNNKVIHRFNAERPTVSLDEQVKGLLTYSIVRKLLNKNSITREYA
jgi:peptidoglycan/xylan/chitin deacetylase (PgdA/CDA1 family)